MSGTQSLLCEMLSCGTMDLELLDRVGYDWDEVLEQVEWPSEGLDFNTLMRAVVDQYQGCRERPYWRAGNLPESMGGTER